MIEGPRSPSPGPTPRGAGRIPGWIPDWAIYLSVLAALVLISLRLAEDADAPSGLPATAQAQAARLGPVTPFDLEVMVDAPDRAFQPSSGTAFSIDGRGRWVTARHVVEGCRRPALMVGGGRAVAAAFRLAPHADVAVLITDGGPGSLPLRALEPAVGQVAFHPGYPQGGAGEVSSRLLGYDRIRSPGRGRTTERVLAWAEMGRTKGLEGGLAGLSGAPALDGSGRVVGVTIAAAPRRGRIYTTTPQAFLQAVRGQADPAAVEAGPMTTANYGRVADDLRRDLRVAQVVCLA